MFVCRIALIGDGAVGKTAIRKRYMGEGFVVNYQATIGADFASKRTTIGDEAFQFQIWDLAGQPLYSTVRKIYYQGAMGGLAIYDCTRHSTYNNILNWVGELWNNCGMGKVPVLLLGNKSDLMEEVLNPVTLEEGKSLAEILSLQAQRTESVRFLPTSAKTGQNVDSAFEFLGNTIVDFFVKRKANKSRKKSLST